MLKVRNLLIVCLLSCLFLSGILAVACAPTPAAPPPPTLLTATPSVSTGATHMIRIQFLGQSCFVITSTTGLKIITDPYTPTSRFTYAPVDESADIVTVSHEHGDHNNVAAVKGNPVIIKGSGSQNIKGIDFKGISTWHDSVQGAERGANTVFCFTLDGVKFCHAGDLGHRLSPEQLAEIGQVDVLFIPVGSVFTVDAAAATEVCNDLKPKVVIPMHYKTPQFSVVLSAVDDFVQGKDNVKQPGT
ncbi:MAG: MBL fold metallo-hydrolase, partial [Chloroflexi bacterium]|nr:MBL fold metallo-hydrolase [Chloroflexota bacterium]